VGQWECYSSEYDMINLGNLHSWLADLIRGTACLDYPGRGSGTIYFRVGTLVPVSTSFIGVALVPMHSPICTLECDIGSYP
jgi:hypothetical protein